LRAPFLRRAHRRTYTGVSIEARIGGDTMPDAQEAKVDRSVKASAGMTSDKGSAARRPAYKVGRLNARLAPDQKALLERAAELTSQTLSEFVVHTAMEHARRVVLEQQVLELSRRDSEIFAEVMLGGAGPNEALKQAASAHAELIAP
jgi:uncharacterized protein (DUF1778 family)